jgi:hypothetical protein
MDVPILLPEASGSRDGEVKLEFWEHRRRGR